MENRTTDYRKLSTKLRRISAGSFALALAAMQVAPAYATIDNAVTASGTAPGGVVVNAGVAPLVEAHVGVQTAAPAITMVKAASFAVSADDGDLDGKGDPTDKITYTYTVTNTGNVTLKNVAIADVHDGVVPLNPLVVPLLVTTDVGSAPAGTLGDSTDATGDFIWDTLGPGDTITFKTTYIVQIGDIQGAGGGVSPDGILNNSATASATYVNTNLATTTPVSSVSAASMPLDVINSITITKSASPSTNVAAGTTVTYTYVVTNTGNTPVSNIDLHDTHKGVLDAIIPGFVSFNGGAASTSTNTGNHIDILQPGDTATYTVDYIVTQSDVDSLQ